MAQQLVNLGTVANEGQDGDDARTAFTKVNENFTEVYAGIGEAQPTNPKLTAIAASVWAANQLMYTTGPNAVAMTPLTLAGRALLDDADAPAQRVTLGLGGQILQALQALTMTANGVPYMTSASAMGVQASTAFGRSLWNVADQAAARTILQLGTASQADVTTSSTDTTANRVTKVGDFGLGNTTGVTITTSQLDAPGLGGGFYRCDPSATFKGLPAGVYGVFVSTLNAANSCAQIAINYITGTVYTRGRYQDNFREGYNTGNAVGTVSQSGGAPTGAIIERGSNANGEYTRYADGTQDCWWENSISSICNGGTYGNLMYGAYVTRNYPMPFTDVPALSPFCRYVTPTEGGVAMLGLATAQRGTSIGCVIQPQGGSATAGGRVGYIAKGRWF